MAEPEAIRPMSDSGVERWELDEEDWTEQDWQDHVEEMLDEAEGIWRAAAEEHDPAEAERTRAEAKWLDQKAAYAEQKLAELRTCHAEDTNEF